MSTRLDALESELEKLRQGQRELEQRAALARITTQNASSSQLSASLDSKLESSVGMIVCGIELKISDGRSVVDYTDIPLSTGTGFIVSDNGLVLTNHHVIEPFLNATLLAKDLEYLARRDHGVLAKVTPGLLFYIKGTSLYMDVISHDADTDYAVLSIRPQQPFQVEWEPLAVAHSTGEVFGAAPARGQTVYACGFPAESQHIVSKAQLIQYLSRNAEARKVSDQFMKEDFVYSLTSGIISRVYQDASGFTFIQHEAIITAGNSGGPLINSEGEVIGINTLASSNAEGYGVALGIESITRKMKQRGITLGQSAP